MKDIWSEEIAKDTAKRLLDCNVYSVDFTKDKKDWTKLPDDTITPCYCNCRYVSRYPEQSRAISNYLETLVRLRYSEAELIVGQATAGIQYASILADRLALPFSYVRGNAKGYGQGNLVEGNPQRGLKAVVLDDLLFTGSSMTRSIDALELEYDIQTVGVATIVALSSWECPENYWQYFRDRNIEPSSLTSYPFLIDELVAREKITKDQSEELNGYYLRPKTYEWK